MSCCVTVAINFQAGRMSPRRNIRSLKKLVFGQIFPTGHPVIVGLAQVGNCPLPRCIDCLDSGVNITEPNLQRSKCGAAVAMNLQPAMCWTIPMIVPLV